MENHILLIDDDEDEGILLEVSLQHCTKQATVHQVMQFEHAVAFAETLVQTPDLIFLDLRLPAVSGLEILMWIRGHHRLGVVPVVVWSHAATADEIAQSQASGGSYFLSKTADQTTIRESMHYICNKWLR